MAQKRPPDRRVCEGVFAFFESSDRKTLAGNLSNFFCPVPAADDTCVFGEIDFLPLLFPAVAPAKLFTFTAGGLAHISRITIGFCAFSMKNIPRRTDYLVPLQITNKIPLLWPNCDLLKMLLLRPDLICPDFLWPNVLPLNASLPGFLRCCSL